MEVILTPEVTGWRRSAALKRRATNSSRSASGSPFVVPADSTKVGKAESPDHEEIQVKTIKALWSLLYQRPKRCGG